MNLANIFKKVLIVLCLMLLGGAITLGAMLFYAKQSEIDDDEWTKQYIIQEQARLSIDCSQLNSDLGSFLENEISPIIKKPSTSNFYPEPLTPALKTNLVNKYSSLVFECYRLAEIDNKYHIGQISSTELENIHANYVILATHLRYPQTKEDCDEKCIAKTQKRIGNAFNGMIDSIKIREKEAGR